jgi:hypothetical protein
VGDAIYGTKIMALVAIKEGKQWKKPCKAMVKTTGGSFGNPSDGKIEQILYENFLGN